MMENRKMVRGIKEEKHDEKKVPKKRLRSELAQNVSTCLSTVRLLKTPRGLGERRKGKKKNKKKNNKNNEKNNKKNKKNNKKNNENKMKNNKNKKKNVKNYNKRTGLLSCTYDLIGA